MMQRSATAAALLSAGLLFSSVTSAAIVGFGSDADFLASGGFTKLFGANARWGNNATNGDWEYAVVDGSDVPINVSGQVEWSGHNIHDPGFTYDGSSAQFVLSQSGTPFADTGAQPVTGDPGLNALAVRARTGNGDTATVSSLVVSFAAGGSVNLGDLVGDDDAEYVMLIDSRLAGGFLVEAVAELQDGGSTPAGRSLPMHGFKVGLTTIPVPAAVWLFASALGCLGWRHRR